MCQKCARLTRPVKMRQTADLFDLTEQLAPYVEGGKLEVIQASSPLPELRRDGPLKDSYFFVLRCTSCGREFQLTMDKNKGTGDWF
jgi:hypothetical protein